MADFYHDKWNFASSIEGASQRVQEDTLKFARIMEGLGAELLRSVMTLIAFTPILWGLSKSITVLPWIGEVDHALVWVAIVSALGGTFILAAVMLPEAVKAGAVTVLAKLTADSKSMRPSDAVILSLLLTPLITIAIYSISFSYLYFIMQSS